ncbi:MAG: bacillithiol biosynthesis cysteine-adding enzyme BshC [Flavobacteriales bacterium]
MFLTKTLSYNTFPFLSPLMKDYSLEKDELIPFIKEFPSLDGIINYAKTKHFPDHQRIVLNRVLTKQYVGMKHFSKVSQHIELLKEASTYTITTGHQLCLFTGPLYFIYKIASIINLCTQCNKKDINSNYVPVFWMASEDHDFEEVNHFYTEKKKYSWNTKELGGVGRMDPSKILELTNTLQKEFGLSINAQKLIQLFEDSYSFSTLSKATQFLANELFGEHGLVVLDADDHALKTFMIPSFEQEIKQELVFKAYAETEKIWPNKYKKQVNARLCNLFYLTNNFRGRLIKQGIDVWTADGLGKTWSEDELIQELHSHPERFSPNVIMRPLYQEKILPNLAYIGGGGELAYWMLFKPIFEAFEIDFPFLILRKSGLVVSSKFSSQLESKQLSWENLLLNEADFMSHYANENYNDHGKLNEIKSLSSQLLNDIKQEFTHLEPTIEHREKEIEKAVNKLSTTLKRNWKRKQTDIKWTFRKVKEEIYPKGKLQERHLNFSTYYFLYQNKFVDAFIEKADVFDKSILIVEEKNED